jgi:hypothetical protein
MIINQDTVRPLTKLNVTVISRLPKGSAWLTVKRYKGFPDTIQVSLHKNNKIN